MPSDFQFTLQHTDTTTSGRAGLWQTPHGIVETPAFMPVGTKATVKGVWPAQLRQIGVQKVLANTYHLALRPGSEVVRDLGGLHKIMNWDGPILTDSGGFQVFSLAELRQINDERVVFKSHLDGSLLDLTPERAVAIQEDLGADCIMCLDECPPHDVSRERIRQAVDRTTSWARAAAMPRSGPIRPCSGLCRGGPTRRFVKFRRRGCSRSSSPGTQSAV